MIDPTQPRPVINLGIPPEIPTESLLMLGGRYDGYVALVPVRAEGIEIEESYETGEQFQPPLIYRRPNPKAWGMFLEEPKS